MYFIEECDVHFEDMSLTWKSDHLHFHSVNDKQRIKSQRPDCIYSFRVVARRNHNAMKRFFVEYLSIKLRFSTLTTSGVERPNSSGFECRIRSQFLKIQILINSPALIR
jgi:hypothetical protein